MFIKRTSTILKNVRRELTIKALSLKAIHQTIKFDGIANRL